MQCSILCVDGGRPARRRTNFGSLNEVPMPQGRRLLVDVHSNGVRCTSACVRSSCCCSTGRSIRWSGNQPKSISHGERSSGYGSLRTANPRLASSGRPHATPCNNCKPIQSACWSTCTHRRPKHPDSATPRARRPPDTPRRSRPPPHHHRPPPQPPPRTCSTSPPRTSVTSDCPVISKAATSTAAAALSAAPAATSTAAAALSAAPARTH